MNPKSPSRERVSFAKEDPPFLFCGFNVFHLSLDYATLTQNRERTRSKIVYLSKEGLYSKCTALSADSNRL
jgi:hypothetical protein